MRRRSTTGKGLRAILLVSPSSLRLRDARLQEHAHESDRERTLGIEVDRRLRLAVRRELRLQRRERRAAERVVRAPVRRCEEARDDLSLVAKRRHGVADALLDLGHDRMDGSPKLLERLTPVRLY